MDDSKQAYDDNGYLFPIDVFSPPEVARARASLEQIEQRSPVNLAHPISLYLRTAAHISFPFVVEMARSKTLLDTVETILGENIMIYSAEFFIKEAGSEKIVTWHQDLTYWGLGETDDELTAWIALSDVNVKSGCMRFVPGSHKQRIQPHKDSFAADNLLSRGQEVAVAVDEDAAVDIELKPGQVSLHHGRMFHASGPNRSDQRRIGLVIRYITPEVEQSGVPGYAMMARGIDTSGNWHHFAPPCENFDPRNLALYETVRGDQQKVLMRGAAQKSKVYV